jgi:EcsC protein family
MARPDFLGQLIDILTEVTSRVPSSAEGRRDTPATRAHELTLNAASQAGAAAGALALPPGPLGMLTIVPDLVAVWHIQRQLVADIAGCYGRSAELRREAMMYCLFRHAAAQVVRDLVVRVGQRWLLRRASTAMMERSMQRVGLVVSQRAVGRTISRWVPLAGAVGVGAYAFYDTVQVGRTAQQLFESELVIDAEADEG